MSDTSCSKVISFWPAWDLVSIAAFGADVVSTAAFGAAGTFGNGSSSINGKVDEPFLRSSQQLPACAEPRFSEAWSHGHLHCDPDDAPGSAYGDMPHAACDDPPPVCDDAAAVRVLLGSVAVPPQPFGPRVSLPGSQDSISICTQYGHSAVDVPPADRLQAHPDRFNMPAMCTAKQDLASATKRPVPLWEKALQLNSDHAHREETVEAHTTTAIGTWAAVASPVTQVSMPAAIFAVAGAPHRRSSPAVSKHSSEMRIWQQSKADFPNLAGGSPVSAMSAVQPEQNQLVDGADVVCTSQYKHADVVEECSNDVGLCVVDPLALQVATREVDADLSTAARLHQHLMTEVKNGEV